MSILPSSNHLSNAKLSTIDSSLTESSSIQKGVVENRDNMPKINLVETISLYAKSFFFFLRYTLPMGLYFAVKQVVLFPFSVAVYLVKQVTQFFWQEKTQTDRVKKDTDIEAEELIKAQIEEQQFSDPGIQYTDRVKKDTDTEARELIREVLTRELSEIYKDRDLKMEFMEIIKQEISKINKELSQKILDNTNDRIELRLTELLELDNLSAKAKTEAEAARRKYYDIMKLPGELKITFMEPIKRQLQGFSKIGKAMGSKIGFMEIITQELSKQKILDDASSRIELRLTKLM